MRPIRCLSRSLFLLLTFSAAWPQVLGPQTSPPQSGCVAATTKPQRRSAPAREPASPLSIVQDGGKFAVTCASPAEARPPAPDRLHDAIALLASWPVIALIAGIVWSRRVSRLLEVLADRIARGGGVEVPGIISLPPEEVRSSRNIMETT